MKAFELSSNTALAYSDLQIVLPFAATQEDVPSLLRDIQKPIALMTPTKKTEDFDILLDLIREAIIISGEDGARPVLTLSFSEQGWDRLAYLFLKNMAAQVKSNPKAMPRSYRSYANLMDKLTEHPTGNGKVDNSRKVVIDRAIEQLAEGVRSELMRRVQSWKN